MPRDFLFPGDVCSSVLLDFSIDTIMSLESQGNISASFSVCAFYSIFLSRSTNCDVSCDGEKQLWGASWPCS